jgi:hypothetical protein
MLALSYFNSGIDGGNKFEQIEQRNGNDIRDVVIRYLGIGKNNE